MMVSYLLCQVFNLLLQLSSHIGGILCPFYNRLILLLLFSKRTVRSHSACSHSAGKFFSCEGCLHHACRKNLMCLLQDRILLYVKPQGSKQFLPTSFMQRCGFSPVCNKLLFSQHEIQISSQRKCACLYWNCVIKQRLNQQDVVGR